MKPGTPIFFDPVDTVIHSNVERWVALTWRTDLFPPPKEVPYGTHLGTFIFCNQGEEIIGLNVCWLVKSSDGQFFKSCEPGVGIGAVWLFKYSTLKQFQITELTALQTTNLNISGNEQQLIAKISKPIRDLRARRELDARRHPGFPDDYYLELAGEARFTGKPTQAHEMIWGRVKEIVNENQFTAELLNQPNTFLGSKGDVVTVDILDSNGTLRMLVRDPKLRPEFLESKSADTQVLSDKLKEHAEEAVGAYRIIFEALEQRLSREYPQVLLAKHWESFVGMGTVAGCFTLAAGLHHEVAEELRSNLEMVMRKRIELRWPGSDAFFEDISRYVRDVMLEFHRSERTQMFFVLSAKWLIEHCTAGERLENEDKLICEIAEVFVRESPGYWKLVQDFSKN